jgi:hypothetical protein
MNTFTTIVIMGFLLASGFVLIGESMAFGKAGPA